jgi:hypothetical protein
MFVRHTADFGGAANPAAAWIAPVRELASLAGRIAVVEAP